MKPGIHPPYGPVVFRDKAAGFAFLTRSTAAGRVERFRRRYGSKA
ncbi:50S ribosomal protein L31 [Streptomyces sp. NPDC090445]